MNPPRPLETSMNTESDGVWISPYVRNALRSLAASRYLPFETVLRAWEADDLRRIVEMRDCGAEQRIFEKNLARISHIERMERLEALRRRDWSLTAQLC